MTSKINPRFADKLPDARQCLQADLLPDLERAAEAEPVQVLRQGGQTP